MASKLRVSELPLPVLALGARLPGLLALLLLLIPATARAHDGPPFPILVDQKVGPCMISVWTDPDVGTGTFFVIVSALPNPC